MPQGLVVHPQGTLVDRALVFLAEGPADSHTLTKRVMGIPQAPVLVADRLVAALLGADPRVGRLGDGRWMLVAPASAAPALAEVSFAVVDCETTGGMYGNGDRITEIAVVAVKGRDVEVLFDSLVNPGRPIPPKVSAVTSITDAMVRSLPPFEAIADDVLSVLAGRVFVAHNVGFDWRFLSQEMRRARGVVLEGPRVCTINMARRLLSGVKSRSLDSLSYYFGIEVEQRHRAGPDALATARLLQRLLALAQDAGATTLRELEELIRRRGRKRRRGGKRRARPESMGEL